MNPVFHAYSSVYRVAMMNSAKSEADVAIAKVMPNVRCPTFFGRLIGR